MKLFTIGYGGRTAGEFVSLLAARGVRALVDVRLRPDRAHMGMWTRAKMPDKGIQHILNGTGIAYYSLPELGNLFIECPDSLGLYRALVERAGELLVGRLGGIPEPYCLLCAERKADECHRQFVADYLAKTRGSEVEHIE
jgi:uncharacterized protein (DUF488 family)